MAGDIGLVSDLAQPTYPFLIPTIFPRFSALLSRLLEASFHTVSHCFVYRRVINTAVSQAFYFLFTFASPEQKLHEGRG